jgi:serine protease AprX
MSRKDFEAPSGSRSSALWGTGNRGGESRSNALWGKGGRGRLLMTIALVALAAPIAAVADSGNSRSSRTTAAPTYIAPSLLAKAQSSPRELVKVIIQSTYGDSKAAAAFKDADRTDNKVGLIDGDREVMKDRYKFVNSVAVTLRAGKLKYLAKVPGLTITPDSVVRLSALPSSKHIWPTASGVRPLWSQSSTRLAPKAPTIAIVDSGIDANRPDFDNGARVIHNEVITKLEPNSPGDGRGHGTFVAGIAAGSAPDNAGASPTSDIVMLDVMDDRGMARTSDVIAAAEWIHENKAKYNIRVANFSLHSVTPSNFTKDPLDKAVEKLWFGGVVVVVASGNYGIPNGPSGVKFAPGNDPFVITVGAIDLEGSVKPTRHDVPSWSAYGYTYDGFRKPEVSAAGRYMVGPVPSGATLKADKPENVLTSTMMRLSGTSFASPIVAGAAAQILARHPDWTPDQVKGALMLTARHVGDADPGQAGVGEINAERATNLRYIPNPNKALNKFLLKTSSGTGSETVSFDAASWQSAATASVSWDSVSWSDASWSDASWQSVSWSDASWQSVSWTDVSWSDVLAMADVSWEDNADGEVESTLGEYVMTPEEEAEARAEGLLPEVPAAAEAPAEEAPAEEASTEAPAADPPAPLPPAPLAPLAPTVP